MHQIFHYYIYILGSGTIGSTGAGFGLFIIDLGYNVYLFKDLTRSVNPLLDEKIFKKWKISVLIFYRL